MKLKIQVLILAIVSLLMGVFDGLVRGVGYPEIITHTVFTAFLPWLIAFILAVGFWAVRKLFNSQHSFAHVYFLLVFSIVLFFINGIISYKHKQPIRDRAAAYKILTAATGAPRLVAFCIKKGHLEVEDAQVVKVWSEQQESFVKKALHIIDKTGGLSEFQIDKLDRDGYVYIKDLMRNSDNPEVTCREFMLSIKAGDMDIQNQKDLQNALITLDKY